MPARNGAYGCVSAGNRNAFVANGKIINYAGVLIPYTAKHFNHSMR